jgi:uncharacterized Rossmann fold enzyme
MIFKEWAPIYEEILKDFKIQKKKDIKSANLLNKLLNDKDIILENTIKHLIQNREVVIFGAGPSLESMINKHKKMLKKKINIASDGTTTALLKYNILPDIIVTDLDGIIKDQINASTKGSIVIIHAHGDNIDKLKKYISEFKNNIIGTTQTDPNTFKNLFNYGGFTDGDRAVFLAQHFKAKKIFLLGFDFNGEIGEYSFLVNKDKNKKLKKLDWCKKLINIVNSDYKKIYYL